jgi:hypothetical protein
MSANDEEGTMKHKFLAALGATVALVLAYGGAAFADNTANGTVGAVQVAPATVSPTATAGNSSASASVSVGGSGDNTANGSTGVVQAGGGNSANRSTGAVQSGGVHGTSTGTTSGPAGAQSLTVPLGVGAGGGNSADGSTGTIQLGGGPGDGSTSATGPTSAAFGDVAVRSLEAAFTSLGFPTATTQRPSGATAQGAGGVSPVSSSGQGRLKAQPAGQGSRLVGQGAASPISLPTARLLGQAVTRGVLPFTGRSLLLWAALGLGIGLLGLGVRARAAV